MRIGNMEWYQIYIDDDSCAPIVIFHTTYFRCRVDHKRNLNDMDENELKQWVANIKRTNYDAANYLLICYETYKKIKQIKDDEEYDKNHNDFMNEYDNCVVYVNDDGKELIKII